MITTTTSRIQYIGNGSTTVFSFPYKFLLNSHVVVYLTDTDGNTVQKSLTTDYTLTGEGTEIGGNVIFINAPLVNFKVTILRVVPLTQLVDYLNNDAFPAETHEAALDKLTMIGQYLDTLFARAVKFPIEDIFTFSTDLPIISARKDKLLGFDSSGNLIAMAFGVDDLTITPPNSVTTADIQDSAVTSAKIAALAVLFKHIYNKTVSYDKVHHYLVVGKKLGIGLTDGSGLPTWGISASDAGTSGANGNYTITSTLDGIHTYTKGSYTLNNTGARWELRLSGTPIYQANNDHGNPTTPDQVRLWELVGAGVAPVPLVIPNIETLEVNGTIKATLFSGSGASLTDVPTSNEFKIDKLPITTDGGQRTTHNVMLIVDKSGMAYSCGLAANGRLGRGNIASTYGKRLKRLHFVVNASRLITGISNQLNYGANKIVKIKTRRAQLFALSDNGILYASGANAGGECGDGTTTDVEVMKALRFGASAGTNVAVIDFSVSDGQSNSGHGLAIDSNGKVWGWGKNGSGQLGTNNTTDQTVPVNISALVSGINSRTVVQVLAIDGSSYVRCSDGTLWSCGLNGSGQLALNDTVDRDEFVQVTTLGTSHGRIWGSGHSGVHAVYVTNTTFPDLRVCGNAAVGALANGASSGTVNVFTDVGIGSSGMIEFWVGGDQNKACFVYISNSNIKCWGANSKGQLGLGHTTSPQTTAQACVSLQNAATAAGGLTKIVFGAENAGTVEAFTVALLANGEIWSTGYNTKGALMQGNLTDLNTFTRVPFPTTAVADIAVIGQSSAALLVLTTSGQLYVAGDNSTAGHLGIDDDGISTVTTPTRVILP